MFKRKGTIFRKNSNRNLEFDGSNIGTGQKAGKVRGTNKEEPNHFAANMSMLQSQSVSEVKIGRDSPICEKLDLIVEQFHYNAQLKIAKTLPIFSPTVHKI